MFEQNIYAWLFLAVVILALFRCFYLWVKTPQKDVSQNLREDSFEPDASRIPPSDNVE